MRLLFPAAVRRLGLLGLFMALCLAGRSTAFYPSDLTAGMRPVLDLHGIWFDAAGNRHISPFNYFDRESIELQRSFDLPDSMDLEQPAFLYFEGLAWTADVYLNGHLLKVTQDAFAEHLLPLRPGMLLKRENELRVHLHLKGKVRPLYPRPFLGIFRQAALLVRGGHVHEGPELRRLSSAPRGVVVAPWSVETDYQFDAPVVLGLVKGMFRYPGNDPLVFPFRPSSHAQWVLADAGVSVLGHPLAADSLAFYNSYAVEEHPLRDNVKFWRHPDGRPAGGYGVFQQLDVLRSPGSTKPDRAALLVLLLAPVLCLLLMKLLTPRFYGGLLEFLTKTQIYLELIANNKFLKAQQALLQNAFRLVIAASSLALLLYYLQQTGSLYRLNYLSRESLAWEVLGAGNWGPYRVFVGIFLLLTGLNALKYMFLNVAGGIYRVANLSPMVQNLDLFASLPFSLLPLFPAAVIFFLEPEAGQVVLTIWQVTFGIWFLRRIVLIYVGLTRLFSFSTSLKFLYICTLEILPWTILL